MTASKFTPNSGLLAAIAQQLADGMTEVDLRIEAAAKAELYPGHGKVTGTLQRAIQGEPATVQGRYVRGRIAVKGVSYARRIHDRYQYLTVGAEKVRPRIGQILQKHVTGGGRG
jgi:hypothetical protein